MGAIEDLQPTQRLLVMNLLEEAGVDVSAWANGKGGVRKAASNPKYCYNWSFEQPGELVVLPIKGRPGAGSSSIGNDVKTGLLAAHNDKQSYPKVGCIRSPSRSFHEAQSLHLRYGPLVARAYA
jgi:hypothetical protein